LFAVFGETFGSGDGITTFNLPDCRGRTLVAAGEGAGLLPRALGDQFGQEQHSLTIEELPQHRFPLVLESRIGTLGTSGTAWSTGAVVMGIETAYTEYLGADRPFNIIQPSLGVQYMIWTGVDGPVVALQPTPAPEVMVYATVEHGGESQAVGIAYTIDAGQVFISLMLFLILVVLVLQLIIKMVGWPTRQAANHEHA
jgi:microcystin-dependent protein